MQRANELSQLVIGAAIEVHRIKGPGLIEEIYSKCLGRECELRNIPCVNFHELVLKNGIYRMILKGSSFS
jgi:GxxExxY protein